MFNKKNSKKFKAFSQQKKPTNYVLEQLKKTKKKIKLWASYIPAILL